jgi:hypothetical protein
MSDQEQTVTAETEGTEDQAETRDQLEEMRKQLEAITKAQSGSDKKVSELTEKLKTAEAEKETTVKTAEERIAALEKETADAKAKARAADLRSFARNLLDEAEMKPPRYLSRLIGNDEEETEQLISEWIEEEKERGAERNREHDAANGRRVETRRSGKPVEYAQLQNMTDEEIAQLPPEEIVRITTEAATNRR